MRILLVILYVRSSITYEFTRKVFELMQFPTKNILNIDFASGYDLISELNRLYINYSIKKYYFIRRRKYEI